VVFDFDGVMTDNRVWVNEAGDETVAFNRGDGLGISMLREAGVEVLVLSTEEHPVVGARCRKLEIPYQQGLVDKGVTLQQWVDASRRLERGAHRLVPYGWKRRYP
jgi:3-deoxy-D-manno-octulosonate 8-phosphate phosphatase KdsC-like HAD superfamily phosphatase